MVRSTMAPLRIATFNLENLDERPGRGSSLDQRIDALRPTLVALQADILCLQEVNAREQPRSHRRTLAALDRLLEGTVYAAYARIAMIGPSGHQPADRQNLVLLSRWTPGESRQVHHSLVPPLRYRPVSGGATPAGAIEARFDRPIIHAAITLPGGRLLHVLNVHFKAPIAALIPGQKHSGLAWKSVGGWAEGFFLAALKRNGQALEVRLLLERLFDADKDALIAVCGDFNAEAVELPVRIVLADPADTGSIALADRRLTAAEGDVPAERRYSVIHAGRRVMLDHILVSKALHAQLDHVEIHNQGLADEAIETAVPVAGSYHAPVVAEFSLPG
jgi:endonuclease/exonuclease/phosphatase family metal-dependent hydrolase